MPARQALDGAALAEQHRPRLLGVDHRKDNGAGPVAGRGSVLGAGAAAPFQPVERGRIDVEPGHLVARRQKGTSHPLAHGAEVDESDSHGSPPRRSRDPKTPSAHYCAAARMRSMHGLEGRNHPRTEGPPPR